MDDTLETLPGEGDVETVIRKHVRIGCDECGESAHFKHTYLLPNARGNPVSSAYRHDDCTWCEDEKAYTCKTCKRPEIDGYGWCSTFPASARFAHMFLKWEKCNAPAPPPREQGDE